MVCMIKQFVFNTEQKFRLLTFPKLKQAVSKQGGLRILSASLELLVTSGLNFKLFERAHSPKMQFKLQQQLLQLFCPMIASCLQAGNPSSAPYQFVSVTIPAQEAFLHTLLPQHQAPLLPSSIVFMVTDCFAISTSTSKISPSELCSLIEGIYKRENVIFTQYPADMTSLADSNT